MSQNLWNQTSETQENSSQSPGERSERNRYDGFEGMNYEQRRQPFNTGHMSNKNGQEVMNGGEDGRPDEF